MDNSAPTLEPSSGQDATCAVGLDIGGTKIAAGIVSFPSGSLRLQRLMPTLPRRGAQAVLDDCLALASEMAEACRALPMPLLGVGIGVPELVDLEGNVTSTHTLAWRGVPVQEQFCRIAPAVVESDVRAAALAEATFGAGCSSRLFVYLTVGTGISHSLVLDGVPFAGARGNALTSASSPLSTVCTACGAHLEPILDEIAAGPALVARYNAAARAHLDRAEQVLAAAESGDPLAIEVVRSGGEALGNTAGFLVNVLDPEILVVGGGLGVVSGLYWDSFVASTRAHIWSDTNRDLPIVRARLGPAAGLIGAAAAVWRRWESRP